MSKFIANMYDETIEKQLNLLKETLLSKQKEYATEDKLHNFRTAAIMQNSTMEKALAGMMSKHTVSLYDMISSEKRFDRSVWDEKINDHIIYLLLLRVIIEEKYNFEYVANIGSDQVMINNPTYSEFMERHVHWPEFLDKTFNVPKEINYKDIYSQFLIEIYFGDGSTSLYTYQEEE